MEEQEEIDKLSEDDSFIKGLTVTDLPPDKSVDDIIKTQWVYDAKPTRRRARIVADGRTDTTTDDTFNPVARTDTFKVVCSVIAQLGMTFGTADVKKAFFKGRFAGRRYFIWAPPGFSSFPSEVWEVMVPIYGLTISARLWYQCISEFLRQLVSNITMAIRASFVASEARTSLRLIRLILIVRFGVEKLSMNHLKLTMFRPWLRA